MSEFDDQLDAIARLRALGARHDDDLYRARVFAQTLRNDLRRALARGDREQQVAIERRLRELDATVEGHRADLEGVRGRINDRVGNLYLRDPHPRLPLNWLDDRTPFLLLPLRLETVFAPTPDGTELQVRVYPDDIAVHTHEAVLTDGEVDAGQLYWVELVVAIHLDIEREPRQRAAWRHLVGLFGGQRAAWVANGTRPTDWEDLAAAQAQPLPDFLLEADPDFFTDLAALPMPASVAAALAAARHDGDALIRLVDAQGWGGRVNAAARTLITGFPVVDVTKTDGWSRAPRTHVLPDRFVLLLYSSTDVAPREIPGELIPDTVYLGPDPMNPGENLDRSGILTFSGPCEWLSDFDTAVAQGMGFRVPLTSQEASAGFARVAVLGVRLSAGAGAGAQMVETLIANHQYGPKGFSLVPQGTPTNNTTADGSGYSDNDPYDDLAFFTDLDAPAFDPMSSDPRLSRTDGRRLADALGIDYEALQRVQHADQTDVLEATALNTALFPATLGYWLRNWASPVVTQTAARLTRDFFTKHVTGRGPLPSVRIGNQPYGVLLTSDLSRWTYQESPPLLGLLLPDEQTPFLRKLHSILQKLEGHWSTLAADLTFIGRPQSDPSAVLVNLLGLHPTSVTWRQRIGYGADYLADLDSFMKTRSYANELYSLLKSMPATMRRYLVQSLGVTTDDAEVAKMPALHVLWQHYTSSLGSTHLVSDGPPSETTALSPDYIDWLAKAATTKELIDESYPGAAPTALLYGLLRNALLLQLHHGSYEWLEERAEFDTALEVSLRPTSTPGIRSAAPSVSRFELMAVRVEAVQTGHQTPGASVADLIWGGPRPAEVEAAYVHTQRASLEPLVGVPTARLSRALAEHLDCCEYRLDAWETGLFAQRLEAQRGTEGDERSTGIYLGAYGWVEPLQANPRQVLADGQLPVALQPADDGPLLEEDEAVASDGSSKRGGYMHAPSISHAVAAAVLRSAYLSHATGTASDMLSVNLSSERVRRAQFVLDGIRNGQPVEALLGYQFERGLHDITSESAARGDVPVLELNEFIQPYRQALPFVSREIPPAGSAPAAETVPPYSVVNGLALTTATLTGANGYGLNTVLPAAQWPTPTAGAAILAQRDAVRDTLDAAKDLLTAENAYQLVQGNFDRVAAVSLAQKDARIPPALEVLNTPRSSRLTFTQRVTLHFADLDPAVPATNPWPGCPMTPRATGEPGLNAWLAEVLGDDPALIQCRVHQVGADDAVVDPRTVTVADLSAQPVDLVALTPIDPVDTGGATELETRIAWAYRRAAGIGLDQTVRIEFDAPAAAPALSLGQLFPLLRRVRELTWQSRSLDARDFLTAPGSKDSAIEVDENNPGGHDAPELRSRLAAAHTMLGDLVDQVAGPTAPTVTVTVGPHTGHPTDETFTSRLGDTFTTLDDLGVDIADATLVSVALAAPGDADTLHEALRGIADFGVADAFPPESVLTADGAVRALLARAHRVARRLRTPEATGDLDRAGVLIADLGGTTAAQVERLQEAGKLLFANTLAPMPAFTYYNEAELAAAHNAESELLSHAMGLGPGLDEQDVIDEWLHGLARVRPRVFTWELVRTLGEALTMAALPMHPVQLPYRDKDSWLATTLPPVDPLTSEPFTVTRDTLALTAHGGTAFSAGVGQRGLLLDEWTEEIPTDSETTGIGFHFNQPNAAPPQALLLAVTPRETGSWDWDDLVGTLSDTLARAKRRAVEPEHLQKNGLVWNALAPATVSEFSAIDTADVSLDLLTAVKFQELNEFYVDIQKGATP